MDLSCDRCLARLSLGEAPVPGRTYRIPCECGNTMLLEIGDTDTHARLLAIAELELVPPPQDDPFACAATTGDGPPELAAGAEARLAKRDPDAPLDESAEYRITGAVSFDDLLRHARLKGFLAGSAAGALGAAAIAAVLAVATSRPPAPATTITALAAPAETAPSETAPAAERVPDAAGVASGAAARPKRSADGAAPPPRAAAPRKPSAPGGPLPEAAVADAAVPPLAKAARLGLDLGPRAMPVDAAPAPEAPPPKVPAAQSAPAAASSAATGARGPFPEREVAEALRARRAALADCVAATPGDAAAARGQRFSLTVVIDPSGQVSDVQIDDPQIEATPLGICLVRLAHTMSFAPFQGGPFRVELALGYGDSE